ncbi:MAG: hypothetical protein LC641_12300 [Spirochaeta sp.]|nr:hypothetical protein [Spirochaeta sp.]
MIELTYLLFLKLAAVTGREQSFPDGCTWNDLMSHSGKDQLGYYRVMLTRLGEDSPSAVVRQIFSFPTTVFTHSSNLRIVADGVDRLDWGSAGQDDFGDLYHSCNTSTPLSSLVEEPPWCFRTTCFSKRALELGYVLT